MTVGFTRATFFVVLCLVMSACLPPKVRRATPVEDRISPVDGSQSGQIGGSAARKPSDTPQHPAETPYPPAKTPLPSGTDPADAEFFQNMVGNAVPLEGDNELIAYAFEGTKARVRGATLGGQRLIFIDADMDIDTDGADNGGSFSSTHQHQTSLNYAVGSRKYVDSNSVPFFVLPWPQPRGWNVKLGATGVIIYKGKMIPALYADNGPTSKIGEASMEAARRLGHTNFRRGIPRGVLYVVFAGSEVDMELRTLSSENVLQRLEKSVSGRLQQLQNGR